MTSMLRVLSDTQRLGTIRLDGQKLTGSTPGLQAIADTKVAQAGNAADAYRLLRGAVNGYLSFIEVRDAEPTTPHMSQREARYQPEGGTDAHRCGTCSMNRSKDGCALVKGKINEETGICAHWLPRHGGNFKLAAGPGEPDQDDGEHHWEGPGQWRTYADREQDGEPDEYDGESGPSDATQSADHGGPSTSEGPSADLSRDGSDLGSAVDLVLAQVKEYSRLEHGRQQRVRGYTTKREPAQADIHGWIPLDDWRKGQELWIQKGEALWRANEWKRHAALQHFAHDLDHGHAGQLKPGDRILLPHPATGQMEPAWVRAVNKRAGDLAVDVEQHRVSPYAPGLPVAGGLRPSNRVRREITEDEARGNSRPVSHGEFQHLAAIGNQMIDQDKKDASAPDGLTGNWDAIKDRAWNAIQVDWGGQTTDAHTGQDVPDGADLYAMSVKPASTPQINVPETTTRAQFDEAMDTALHQYGEVTQAHQDAPLLWRQGYALGVFHDNDTGRIDIDPVLIVHSPYEVEAVGAYAHSVGGAYHFADGNGYWPPHVDAAAEQFAVERSTVTLHPGDHVAVYHDDITDDELHAMAAEPAMDPALAGRVPTTMAPVTSAISDDLTARPVLYPDQRRLLLTMKPGSDDALAAMQALRADQPLTSPQLGALAGTALETARTTPEPTKRALQRIAGQLYAGQLEILQQVRPDEARSKAAEAAITMKRDRPVPTTAGQLTAGDAFAFRSFEGSMAAGVVKEVATRRHGRLTELKVEDPQTGDVYTHLFSSRTQVYRLPDLPPDKPVPKAAGPDPLVYQPYPDVSSSVYATMKRAYQRVLVNITSRAEGAVTYDEAIKSINRMHNGPLMDDITYLRSTVASVLVEHDGGPPGSLKFERQQVVMSNLTPLFGQMVQAAKQQAIDAIDANRGSGMPINQILGMLSDSPPLTPEGADALATLSADASGLAGEGQPAGPPPHVPGPALSMDTYRAALGDPEHIGKHEVIRTSFAPPQLAQLNAGIPPPTEERRVWVPDVAADGGPGETTMAQNEIVRRAGAVLHGKVEALSEKMWAKSYGEKITGLGLQTRLRDMQNRANELNLKLSSRSLAIIHDAQKARDDFAKQHGFASFGSLVMQATYPGRGQMDKPELQRLRRQGNDIYEKAARKSDAETVRMEMEARRLQDEIQSIRQQAAMIRRAAAMQVISEARGEPNGSIHLSYTAGRGAARDKADLEDAIRWAEAAFPDGWLGAAEQHLSTSWRGIFLSRGSRGSYNDWSKQMILDDTNVEIPVPGVKNASVVAQHELGHVMEHSVTGLPVLENAELWRRTATGAIGSRNQDPPTGEGQAIGEKARGDHFPNRYSGKYYAGAQETGHPTDFEMMSMATEALYGGQAYLDDDYENWALGVLALLPGKPAKAHVNWEPTGRGTVRPAVAAQSWVHPVPAEIRKTAHRLVREYDTAGPQAVAASLARMSSTELAALRDHLQRESLIRATGTAERVATLADQELTARGYDSKTASPIASAPQTPSPASPEQIAVRRPIP